MPHSCTFQTQVHSSLVTFRSLSAPHKLRNTRKDVVSLVIESSERNAGFTSSRVRLFLQQLRQRAATPASASTHAREIVQRVQHK